MRGAGRAAGRSASASWSSGASCRGRSPATPRPAGFPPRPRRGRSSTASASTATASRSRGSAWRAGSAAPASSGVNIGTTRMPPTACHYVACVRDPVRASCVPYNQRPSPNTPACATSRRGVPRTISRPLLDARTGAGARGVAHGDPPEDRPDLTLEPSTASCDGAEARHRRAHRVEHHRGRPQPPGPRSPERAGSRAGRSSSLDPHLAQTRCGRGRIPRRVGGRRFARPPGPRSAPARASCSSIPPSSTRARG
jgi:hypothetical protein